MRFQQWLWLILSPICLWLIQAQASAQSDLLTSDSYQHAPVQCKEENGPPLTSWRCFSGPVCGFRAWRASGGSCVDGGCSEKAGDSWLHPYMPNSLQGWKKATQDEVFMYMYLLHEDFKNYYYGKRLLGLGLAVAAVAPLANTKADENFSRWYQDNVRSEETDEWSEVGKFFGDHKYMLPIYFAAAMGGRLAGNTRAGNVAHTWGNWSFRALVIGSPAVGLLQFGLGAGRPDEEHGSRWRPFQDTNSVAGHGYVGAIPFLTAAAMTKNRPLKYGLLLGSFWTSWSRINDDAHFLSQAILGWWIAYQAVQSVNETDWEERRLRFSPMITPEYSGVGLHLRY